MKPVRLFLTLLGLASVAVVGWSCTSDQGPTAPVESLGPVPQQDLLGSVLGSLLRCDPLPAASVTRVIGPAGGTIRVGPHELVIPARALRRQVAITAEIPRDTVNSVRLSPEGLSFERPARLTLSYANCPLVGRLLPKKVAYTTEGLRIIEMLRSLDNLLRKEVSAPLDHFSRYAVAW